MTYVSSLFQNLPEKLSEPNSIAILTSIGLHAAIGIGLVTMPSFSDDSTSDTRTVSLMELSPAEQSRLPDLSTPSFTLPPLPDSSSSLETLPSPSKLPSLPALPSLPSVEPQLPKPSTSRNNSSAFNVPLAQLPPPPSQVNLPPLRSQPSLPPPSPRFEPPALEQPSRIITIPETLPFASTPPRELRTPQERLPSPKPEFSPLPTRIRPLPSPPPSVAQSPNLPPLPSPVENQPPTEQTPKNSPPSPNVTSERETVAIVPQRSAETPQRAVPEESPSPRVSDVSPIEPTENPFEYSLRSQPTTNPSPTLTPSKPAATPESVAIRRAPASPSPSPQSSTEVEPPRQAVLSEGRQEIVAEIRQRREQLARNTTNTTNEEAKKNYVNWLAAVEDVKPTPVQIAGTYPEDACFQKLEGTTVYGVLVDGSGTVTDLELIKSSGYPIFNDQARQQVNRHNFSASGEQTPYQVNVEFKYNAEICPSLTLPQETAEG